jgi:large subunit ribosomal protein L21
MSGNWADFPASRSDFAGLAYGILLCRGCVDAPGFALHVARIPGRHPAGVKERAKIVMTDTEPGTEPEQPAVPAKVRSKSASDSASYAIIETGGKQYRVAVGDTLSVEKLSVEPGSGITFDRVLMVGGDGSARVGTPLVTGATVQAEVAEQYRGPKIVVFRYKPKKRYRRRTGHRQSLTRVAITAINA